MTFKLSFSFKLLAVVLSLAIVFVKDFVLWSQANGYQMCIYTNATLSKSLELLRDSGIIRVVPLG